MGNFESIKALRTFLVHDEPTEEDPHPKDLYGVELKVEPTPNESFKINHCLANCPLYLYAQNHDPSVGNCSGPTGKHGNILYISTQCTAINAQLLSEAFARSQCHVDEGQNATLAILEYLW